LSEYSQKALAYAKVLCQDYDAALQIIHVVEDRIHPALYTTGKSSIFDFMPDIKEKSSKLIKDMLEQVTGPDVQVTTKVTEGIAAREILKYTEKNNIDLIIISTHGRSGLDHFLLGSVTEKIVRRSKCPVFTVKSFGKHLI
jgi:nucleotide-binding universal stress UspA family protein